MKVGAGEPRVFDQPMTKALSSQSGLLAGNERKNGFYVAGAVPFESRNGCLGGRGAPAH